MEAHTDTSSDLIDHAKLTINILEQRLSRRGKWSTGKKRWELQLLFSAYESLGVAAADRKFGLDKETDISKIRKPW
jgi:hypothetical protein